MRHYIKLSYDIGINTPLYPDTPPVSIKSTKSIGKGDSCNTSVISFSNHTGTHIDMPKHFIDSGRTVCDYSMEELIFKRPHVVDCPKGAGEIIEIKDLTDSVVLVETDFLLIRTGFSRFRNADACVYSNENPCLSPHTAEWIRNNFPDVRAIGVDCISISSHAHRDLGKETHRMLLRTDGFKGRSVLIVEDLYIPFEINKLDELIVAPLFIESIDSAPCTVIGVVTDK